MQLTKHSDGQAMNSTMVRPFLLSHLPRLFCRPSVDQLEPLGKSDHQQQRINESGSNVLQPMAVIRVNGNEVGRLR